MNLKTQLIIGPVLALGLILASPAEANDSFGSWGGGGSLGSYGGGGYGSYGGGYGSYGGPVRNLLARRPLRNLLGRVRGRLADAFASGGSYGGGAWGGGYGGSYGSGYTTGGSWGGYASYNTGGSWGSSYTSYPAEYAYTPAYSSTVFPAPVSSSVLAAPTFGSPTTYDSGCSTCGTINPTVYGSAPTTSYGTPIDGSSSVISNGYYDSGMGQPVTGGSGSTFSPTESELPGDSSGGSFNSFDPSPGGSHLDPPSGGSDPVPGPDNDVTGSRGIDSVVDIQLPSDAIVWVNGRRTSSKGDVRNFVARNQKPGSVYRYQVKAVLDGVEKVEEFTMLAGGSKKIDFDFDESAVTTVKLLVPADATVILAGNETKKSDNETRKFTTRQLSEGEVWEDYDVVVKLNRNGEELVQRKSLKVVGGNSYTIAFDFDAIDGNSMVSR